ncbi:fatty acid desaturase CarF family protein [Sphingomonas solaris]|uniref:Carotenoid synthesis regulator CarF n=1 Tax=Alterirhizorhabdus solaris TaxID=2529389 RepID=A0A558R1X9_9SPHN|nr:fatty acid desaturase CarF family protein [Sphingomonas solaris]TVV73384.1 carotenoid synthesis regulator CarF [Sphingomonas solaris]
MKDNGILAWVAYLALGLSLAGNLWFVGMPGWALIPAALAGWYLADLMSGAIHMYMDYRPCRSGIGLDRLYFYEGSRDSDEYRTLFGQTMRQIGPIERLVFDFKNHHPRPLALGRRNLWRQIGSTVIIATLPASLALNLLCWAGLRAGWPVPGWFTGGAIAFLLGGTFAQYFHGTLHRERNPWFIHLMRRLGLLMTPQAHNIHHETLARDFSTNSGWSNPVLNRVFAWVQRRGGMDRRGLEPY